MTFSRHEWTEVRRGCGSIELSELGEDECVTASGLRDGGYIVWKRLFVRRECKCGHVEVNHVHKTGCRFCECKVYEEAG